MRDDDDIQDIPDWTFQHYRVARLRDIPRQGTDQHSRVKGLTYTDNNTDKAD